MLDSAAELVFDRLTRVAVLLLKVPAAFLSFVDETRDVHVSACDEPGVLGGVRETSGITLCQYVIHARTPLVIPDTRADSRSRDSATVTMPGIASYIGVPVIIDGQALGSLCVIDSVPRIWTDAEVDLLVELAVSVQREIELRGAPTPIRPLDARVADRQMQVALARDVAPPHGRHRRRLRDVLEQPETYLAVLRAPSGQFELHRDTDDGTTLESADVGQQVIGALREGRAHDHDAQMTQVRLTGEPLTHYALPVTLTGARDSAPQQKFFDVTYARLVEAGAHVDAVIASAVDVTDHVCAQRARELAERLAEESEAQLRTFADALPVLAWMARADGHTTWYNARWYEYTGTTATDMEGSEWQHVHDPAVLPTVLTRWTSALASGEPYEMQLPLRASDGAFHMFLTRVVPARDVHGVVTGWFGTHMDIETEVRLRQRVKDADRAKGEFLAVMSHELRTPLNAIDGYAELMALGIRGPVTHAQSQDLSRIRKSQKQLLGLINGVLNLSHLEAGAVQYDVEDVAVDEVLATCELLTSTQADGRHLTLHRQKGDPTTMVQADAEKLEQIVLNLLSNAIKFTDAGGKVDLGWTRAQDEAHATIHVTVMDTGIGIPERKLSRIFDPFVQIDSSLTRTHEGAGLGLAISRDLARGMGGDVTATSVLGRGSTFTLVLPTHMRALR